MSSPKEPIPLNDSETVVIGKTSQDTVCDVTGDTLQEGEHVLFLRHGSGLVDGQRVLSANGFREVEEWLQSLPDGDHELKLCDAVVNGAEYGEYPYLAHPCMMCDETYQHKMCVVFGRSVRAPWCHEACREDVIDAIGKVWSQTDLFLTEQL